MKENEIYEIFNNVFNRRLTRSDIDNAVDAIISYDGLFEDFVKNPTNILNELKASKSNNNLIYVPVYALELRQILDSNFIYSPYKVAAFNYDFIKHFFNNYHAIIALDKNKLQQPVLELPGITVYDVALNIKKAVVKVYSKKRGDSPISHVINNIINKQDKNLTFHLLADPPGMSVSAHVSELNKFVVNIRSLGIDNEVVNSHSEREAVQEALNRKKQEKNIHHHDPKYNVAFWEKSEFWSFIVKKVGTTRTAQAQEINIQLSSQEKQIFDLLLKINKKYNLGLTFRVAGGWVRDKALGKESDDIDIALDKMTGSEFGKYLQKEIGKSGNVIKANPDQSKHLETMTVNLFGQDVDFVNLRTESYGDSRIPTMEFGDPQTDASRRDLTINSLFYNVNSGQIEDFTGKGLEDLQSMTLRTPLDPIKTFKDDPLRILRMLRFYSRYQGSNIDPASIEAMKNPEVQQALKTKVSPERVYTEWNKLFSGKQPTSSLRILHDTGLWQVLFGNYLKSKKENEEDINYHPFTMDQNNPHHVDNVLEHTLKVIEEYNKILIADGAGDEERAKALTAAFFHDLGKLDPRIIGIKETIDKVVHNTYHGHEDESAKVAEAILAGLKASNEDIQYISSIVSHHMLPHNDMSDKQIRKLINKLGKDLLRRIIQHAKADANSKPGADLTHYDSLLDRVQIIQPSGNMNSGNMKPVLSGQVLMQMFPNLDPKSGFIKEINTKLQDMKDENPAMTDQDAVAFVENMRSAIEAQFSAFIKTPKINNQQNMKQAQTWYETMRTMGEKPNRIEWICGLVTKADELSYFDTGLTKYQLMYQGKYKPEIFDNLENKNICGKGFIEGTVFHIETWTEQEKTNQNADLMQREKPKDMSSFEVGMKVRHRKRGLSFPQINGVVEKINNNLLYVKWKGIPELEVFDLNDTVNLHLNLTKA